ncbi:hypothetical protein J2Y88_000907 [Pseudomonas chlororaphis]|nr:hypothetical protein [Pseudomonas chlororaphis]MCP1595052.1 hypothetical protein [Pseudomonas chlororaphis]
MQHIIGMPLQLIIIGMPQSFIIFIIRAQQLFIMSMFMPAIGMILHIMQSASTVHSITHFIDGIGMPIIGIGIMAPIIGMAMLAWDMHIMLMLAQCIIIGMPQFIIICIICALFLNMVMSMPAAGIILHNMPSSIISQLMVAIIIGMPIIGIIGMLAFIGICICMAFIMVKLPKRFDSWTKLMGRILGSGERRTRCRSNSNRGCRDSFSAAARAGFSASAAGWISWRTGAGQQRVFRCDGYARISASHNPKK